MSGALLADTCRPSGGSSGTCRRNRSGINEAAGRAASDPDAGATRDKSIVHNGFRGSASYRQACSRAATDGSFVYNSGIGTTNDDRTVGS
jgi:hypothetical protein